MPLPRRHHPFVPLLLLCCAAPPLRGAEFFVAPTGADGNPGTRALPFATVARARDAVRASGRAGREPVTVTVAPGIYPLAETLVFTAVDSGGPDSPVIYRAAGDGEVVLSGGSRLALEWRPAENGVFRARTPPGLVIDQLFVAGRRQPLARYPNFDAAVLPYNGFAADAFSRERAAGWADPAGGFIHAMHAAHWGGYHYRITGKNAAGDVTYEGGWQNNRQMGMHPTHRFVENIREELDAPGEWFHDPHAATLHAIPPPGVDLATAEIDAVRLRRLVELRGSAAEPVRFLTLAGFVLRHSARTFMETREPLLRSDWTICRAGAILVRDAEDCAILDCELDQPGGNGIFVSGRNRRVTIRGCHIHGAGASGVCLVGDPSSVREPLFEYSRRQSYAAIDKTPGPRGDDHPADCVVDDCLIHGIGVVEKQAAGVQISMAKRVTVRHCSIYDVGRAGINVSEGTFGGHLIEFCDVFDTVRETGDHGSFNSWGRDRYWGLEGAPAEELPRLALLDTETSVIRNSRWRCDHGWDVDLDDGSSAYEITDNLFLRGGLKLREGFHRIVRNNIAINTSLHPHVWYDDSGDVVTGNIWMGAYRPAGGMPKGRWGGEIDRNLFTAEADRMRFVAHGCDANSLVGDPLFIDPAHGDFRVADGSPALRLGFRNFAMDSFGVRKAALRRIARTPEIPRLRTADGEAEPAPDAAPLAGFWQGATVRAITGEEFSAFGASRESGGVHVVAVPAGCCAARAGLRAGDLVQGLDGRPVRAVEDLARLEAAAAGKPIAVTLLRGQQPRTIRLEDYAVIVAEDSVDGSFATLGVAAADAVTPVRGVTARPATRNEPLATLHDGRLAENYGPVFANGGFTGIYRIDLGSVRPVAAVTTWTANQNGNRGPQRFTLYGSAAGADPGWAPEAFVPLARVDTTASPTGRYHATRVRSASGSTLGDFRWLMWAAHPLNPGGEHSAYQEFQVTERAPAP